MKAPSTSNFFGIAALVVLIFGLLTAWLIQDDIYHVAIVHFVLAGALLLAFFLFRKKEKAEVSSSSLEGGTGFKQVFQKLGFLVQTFLVLGVLVLVNVLANKNEFLFFDSTKEKVFSLAPQTSEFLERLDREVKIRAFFTGGAINDIGLKNLLERAQAANPKLSLEIIDPEKEPSKVEIFGISEPSTLHFSFTDADKNSPEENSQVKISGNLDEQNILTALNKLSNNKPKAVYYLSGHGEPDTNSDTEAGYLFFKEALEGENLVVNKLIIAGAAQIPEDAEALIVASPKRALLKKELEAIKLYLENGGRVLAFFEPRYKTGLRELLKYFYVNVGEDIVIDQAAGLSGGAKVGTQLYLNRYGPHPITKGFREACLFSGSSSVLVEDLPKHVAGANLVLASPESWAEGSLDLVFSETPVARKDKEDIQGNIPIAAAVEINPGEKSVTKAKARIVAFGDSDFVNNLLIRQVFNRDLFLNSVNWLIGQDSQITIRPRTLAANLHPITVKDFSLLFLLTGVILPELVVLSGLFIYSRRR